MSATHSKSAVLGVYRSLLRNSKNFQNYNFREYALRRTREDFRVNRNVSDPAKLAQLMLEAEQNLAVVKRQAALSMMYASNQQYVVELKK